MVERVLVGKHPDTGVTGMWISKATKNARTSTNTDDFLFDPAKYLARPYVRGTIINFAKGTLITTRTTTYNGQTAYERWYQWYFQFAHGLSYVPLYTTQAGSVVALPYCNAAAFYCLANGDSSLSYALPDGLWSASTGGTLVLNYESTTFLHNTSNDTMTSKSTFPANFAIYRNQIA